jgi:glycerophosphoryl diester phosphodiesterase
LKKLADILFDPLFRSSWRSVMLLWKPMAGWTVLVYAVFTSAMAPVLVALLNWSVFRNERMVVGNTELYTWFFSPSGFIYLFIAILILLSGLVIRYAGLYQILTDHLQGNQISVRDTALHILPKIPVLIRLCAVTVTGALILLLPLLAGLGLIYFINLSQFDIHYYLISTPPEWYTALTWGAVWGVIWATGALVTIACLLPALPSYLDGKKSVRQAILDIWHAPMLLTLNLIKSVILAGLIWFILRISADAALLYLFVRAAGWLQSDMESLRLIAIVTGNYLFLVLFSGALISFFGFSMISVLITKYYHSISRPSLKADAPGFLQLTQKTLVTIARWLKPSRALLLIMIIVTGGFVSSLFIASLESDELQILNIAHRANSGEAPENSLVSLENAINSGADMAEIDVQLTADSVVVVLHDADLMRIAGDPRRVTDVTSAELNELRLMSGRDIPDELLKIPTLDEFLDRARGRIPLLIELKYYGFNTLLAEKVTGLIREKEMAGETLVMSLTLQGVQQMNRIAPDLTTGYTSAVAAGDLQNLPVRFLAVYHPNITPALVRRQSLRGQPVFAWTVNTTPDMLSAIEKGAGGLITDHPELAGRVIEEVSSLTRAERFLLQFGLFIFETEEGLGSPPPNVQMSTMEGRRRGVKGAEGG